MNKPGWLLTQTATKGLVLILVLGLSLGACPRSFAQDDDPGLLNQQQNKLYQEGKYQEAIPIAEKLLAIRKRVLGPNHPDTASTLSDLAVLYYKTGDYTKAEPLFRRALQIREKVLGPEHPDTATSLNNLAELYRVRGDYAKAEPLYQQALQITKKVLGPEHPAVNQDGHHQNVATQSGRHFEPNPILGVLQSAVAILAGQSR